MRDGEGGERLAFPFLILHVHVHCIYMYVLDVQRTCIHVNVHVYCMHTCIHVYMYIQCTQCVYMYKYMYKVHVQYVH